jgi:hypothetical protein
LELVEIAGKALAETKVRESAKDEMERMETVMMQGVVETN